MYSKLVPRTREGYYHFVGGIEPAIARATAFAPYSDLVWLETKTPDLEQARYFARKIREQHPGKYDFKFMTFALLHLTLFIGVLSIT
jgi:isocitrate lyase